MFVLNSIISITQVLSALLRDLLQYVMRFALV